MRRRPAPAAGRPRARSPTTSTIPSPPPEPTLPWCRSAPRSGRPRRDRRHDGLHPGGRLRRDGFGLGLGLVVVHLALLVAMIFSIPILKVLKESGVPLITRIAGLLLQRSPFRWSPTRSRPSSRTPEAGSPRRSSPSDRAVTGRNVSDYPVAGNMSVVAAIMRVVASRVSLQAARRSRAAWAGSSCCGRIPRACSGRRRNRRGAGVAAVVAGALRACVRPGLTAAARSRGLRGGACGRRGDGLGRSDMAAGALDRRLRRGRERAAGDHLSRDRRHACRPDRGEQGAHAAENASGRGRGGAHGSASVGGVRGS